MAALEDPPSSPELPEHAAGASKTSAAAIDAMARIRALGFLTGLAMAVVPFDADAGQGGSDGAVVRYARRSPGRNSGTSPVGRLGQADR
ncbi:hypothetical protein [Cryptosporangium sp. NPDC048952]|uniref:hypothetical protein n=1 Tax=Cryptosporangium sp. NPDC048952 TaxID=3363961 RepID=UPI0037182DCB